MLSELTIENIAVIDKVTINFTCGFNCLTGETGAGKSIIIDAINCITGEKTSRDLIRSDEKFAKVTAVFCDLPTDAAELLSENDIPNDESELIVSRKITRDGKNTCRVNDCPVTVAFLRRLGDMLVNIHGQNDSKNLLDSDIHFSYLDLFGSTQELLNEYRDDYRSLSEIRSEIKRLSVNEAEKLKEIDMLDFQINELSSANIYVGETEELKNKRNTGRNARKIAESLMNAYSYLNGDDTASGAFSLADNAADELESISDYVPDVSEYAETLRDMSSTMLETANDLKTRLDGISFTENELNAIEDRLDFLNRLSRKYGDSEEKMLSYLEKAQLRRKEIDIAEDRLFELNNLFDEKADKAKKSAKALSKKRREIAVEFSERVCSELKFLDMPNVNFTVADTIVPLNYNGVDSMCFMFSANKGEDVKPLSKIASGGEMSRVMLAIKNVLSECDNINTLIFDEIDTGISGRAAEKTAMKLYEVSRGRQVICVTHLAQLAMFADSHFLIAKSSENGKTYTTVNKLEIDERCAELARISSGSNIGKLQLDSAKEMIKYAEKFKNQLRK